MPTLNVGSGQKYTTIQAAVAASSSGDTIHVHAGTYIDDFINITHDLTVQAVGGAVNLVATVQPPNGKAYIDEGGSGVSVTLDGLTISGVTVPDGNGAAIRYEGGSLVLNNDTVMNNEEGLLSAPDPSGTITINNSTFSNNGIGDGYTHNIYVGAIGQLKVMGSTITAAVVGHDIKSRAASTIITGNTITDGPSGSASYEIDLPNGGNAVISNNTIEKGTNASNPIAISYGEEGVSYASNSLVVSGNALTDDNTEHLGYGVRNAASDVTAAVSGNTFSGWQSLTSGSATLSDNTVVASGSAPVSAPSPVPVGAPAPAPVSAPAGNPLFDTTYYLANNPDVAAAGVDPYTHFHFTGWHEGRNPDALFNTNYYLAQNPDVAAAGIDPLVHYDTQGWKEGRNPAPAFDTNAYLNANPDVKAAGVDPLAEYLATGAAEGRDIYAVSATVSGPTSPPTSAPVTAPISLPNSAGDPVFDAAYYLAKNPDVAAAGVDPYTHFHYTGWIEGRSPSALFDTNYYQAQNPDVAQAHIDPLEHFENQGWHEGRNPDALFDTNYYLAQNPDVAAAGIDPLVHYDIQGWKEGRNPSAAFDTNAYLNANGDVRAAGVDPLAQYLSTGAAEGRAIYAVT